MRKSMFVLVAVVLLVGSIMPAAVSAQEPPTISMLVGTMDNPYWITVTEWAQVGADMMGVNLVVLGIDTESDSVKQFSQLEDRIAQGDDAIVIAVQDTQALIPAIEQANEAGIPLIAIDKTADAGQIESVIMTDNIAAAYDGAKLIAEMIGGAGTVLVLEGVPGGQTANDRKTGAHNAFAEYPDIEVVSLTGEWQTAKGQSVTEDVLTAHPELAGIFASNDMMAMGAVAAVNAAGVDIPVCGFDAVPPAQEMVADGRLVATVAQFPGKMGFLGVEYAVRVLDGKEVPPTVNSGAMVVDGDNVLAFQAGLYGQ